MNADEIIKSIVEEVLRRLNERMKKALVVFTGGSIGFSDAINQLRRLMADGWDLKIVLSNSAEYVLNPQLIKEMLGVEQIYLEREAKGLKAFYSDVSLMIIPTLTLNTAVKMALGVADTLATNIASHVIMEGIPIIAAKDACDLQNPTRRKLGMDKTPRAYLDRMNQYLQTLETYGIRLVEAKELYQAVQEKKFNFSQPPIQQSSQTHAQAESAAEIQTFTKRVLSRPDVIEAKNSGSVLRVSHTTIVTALALDTAKEIGVKIITE